jgi:hypothetical protein
VSATIAAQTFALLGQRSYLPNSWVSDHVGLRSAMPLALRSSVAKMLASYMPDVFRTHGVKNPKADHEGGSWTVDADDEAFPPGQPFGAKLDPKLVEQIIGTLGENESDIQIVTAGVMAAHQVRMAYALDHEMAANPNSPVMVMKGATVTFLENASMESAGVLGWVVSTGYAGDLKNEELQKKQAELLSKTVSIATALPIFKIGEGVGEWSKYAFDQLKSQAISEIGKAPKGSSKEIYGKMDQGSQNALRDSTFNLMLQGGYLRPEHFAQANRETGGSTYRPPPPTALKGHRGSNGQWVAKQPPEFDLTSDTYLRWARNYGDNGWISDHVYVPYSLEWPNTR